GLDTISAVRREWFRLHRTRYLPAGIRDEMADHTAPFPWETSCPGVFAAGDVRANSTKRVASAVGEGSVVVQYVHATGVLSLDRNEFSCSRAVRHAPVARIGAQVRGLLFDGPEAVDDVPERLRRCVDRKSVV